jgi:hypothetical protein
MFTPLQSLPTTVPSSVACARQATRANGLSALDSAGVIRSLSVQPSRHCYFE